LTLKKPTVKQTTTPESTIQSQIRVALSEHGLVFRTNAGEFWQGDIRYSQEFRQNVLINLRKVSGLPPGFSDLLWIGDSKVAFIECKTATGDLRTRQQNFLDIVTRLHHRAGIARSVEDALKIIGR
jgi:hypothetical protein